jgi:hypothetical protein
VTVPRRPAWLLPSQRRSPFGGDSASRSRDRSKSSRTRPSSSIAVAGASAEARIASSASRAPATRAESSCPVAVTVKTFSRFRSTRTPRFCRTRRRRAWREREPSCGSTPIRRRGLSPSGATPARGAPRYRYLLHSPDRSGGPSRPRASSAASLRQRAPPRLTLAHPSSLPVVCRDFRLAADSHTETRLTTACPIASDQRLTRRRNGLTVCASSWGWSR